MRGPSDQFMDKYCKPTFKSGRTRLGVAGATMGTERGPLICLPEGTRMNSQTYIDLILVPHYIPFYSEIDGEM